MRLSVAILLFLILLNGWAVVLQDYGLDDHYGINAELGNTSELDQAEEEIGQGAPIGSGGFIESIVGVIDSGKNYLQAILSGLNPAGQMLANLFPAGIAQDIVIWSFGFIELIIVIDILNWARGI